MPFNPANAAPGVYVFEKSSGVHTITGVATSITAFIGNAPGGPVNQATRVLSFADYERAFGGLSSDSLMGYSVQHFFLNGGSDAWIVRVAGQGITADAIDIPATDTSKKIFHASVPNPGASGRVTSIFIEREKDDAGQDLSTFKLAVVNSPKPPSTGTTPALPPPNAPKDAIVETYTGLAVGKTDAHYIVKEVNAKSKLIKIESLPDATDTLLPANTANNHGAITSDTIADSDIKKLPHDKDTTNPKPAKSFRITLDNTTPYTVTLPLTFFKSLDDAASGIQAGVRALKKGDPAFDGFTCTVSSGKLILASGSYGNLSSVLVEELTGDTLASDLKLAGKQFVAAQGLALTGASNGVAAGAGTTGEFEMYIGSRANFEGIYALDKVDLVNLICLPGVVDTKILSFVDAYCLERRSFMLVDAPENQTPNQMFNAITSTAFGALKTDHGAIYYPRPQLPDPLDNGNLRTFPACGVIAGLYARIDGSRGVWKAPAGTEATLAGVLGFEYMLNDGENGVLNSQGVDCLRFFPTYGFVSWGARTLRGADNSGSEYAYVPVRRTALFLEESLYRGLQWAVFEPNDEPLWAQIRLNVGAFMNDLFRKGAFQGKTPRDAYFVKCDSETTTQEDIDRGIVNVVVGFAPLKPAEFVVVTVQQIAGQLQV